MPKNESQKKKKSRVGVVLSNNMSKTIVVKVERLIAHPVYKKRIHRYSQFKVHDEKEEARIGDKVKIEITRPLSKEKRWRLTEILK